MNTQPLKSLMKAIQDAPGKTSRQKMEACMQILLCTLAPMAYFQGGLDIQMDYRALGFTPVGKRESHPWERELVKAYMEAVMWAPPFTDILSDVHGLMLYDRKAEGLGQHFTPKDLAQLTADLAECHTKRHKPKGDTVYDPTCGAGGLILPMLAMRDEAHLARTTVVAQDIDPLCSAMTALQILAGQVVSRCLIGEVRVECKNVLTVVEERTVFRSRRDLNEPQHVMLEVLRAGSSKEAA